MTAIRIEDYPLVLNYDGESLGPDGKVLRKLQQNTYWPGWRMRMVTPGGSSEPITQVRGEVRTKLLSKGGELVMVIRCTLEEDDWWRFDIPLVIREDALPVKPDVAYPFDIDIVGPDARPYTPITGVVMIQGEVTSG